MANMQEIAAYFSTFMYIMFVHNNNVFTFFTNNTQNVNMLLSGQKRLHCYYR